MARAVVDAWAFCLRAALVARPNIRIAACQTQTGALPMQRRSGDLKRRHTLDSSLRPAELHGSRLAATACTTPSRPCR